MVTTLNTTTYKVGLSSLNLTKTGTAGVSFYTEKNTTSWDFTSKEFSIWIFIDDAGTLAKLSVTDCLKIWFGNDSSNYFEWTKDRVDLSVGWNLIHDLTSLNGAQTGTVTLNACDYTRIILETVNTTDTWSAGKFAMDDLKLISSGDYVKNLESGYPVIDFNTMDVTMRARLATANANGYYISEVGIFNTDNPKLIESRMTFTPISKSVTDEIIFVIKTTLN
jgi:hypothetical protein